jgi:hypothetical protein
VLDRSVLWNCSARTFVVLLTLGSALSVFADEPVREVADTTVGKEDNKTNEQPRKVDGVQAGNSNAVEPFNPETVAAPLRAIIAAAAQAEAPKRVRRVGNAAVNAAAQNDAMIQQFQQQLRPAMTSELGFVRLICSDLTPEQRKKIKASAQAGLKEAAKATLNQQNGQRVRVAGARGKSNEARAIIRDSIEAAMKESVSEELLNRYIEATSKRTERRKQTAIVFVIARMDNQLYLTPEQRDKIAASITAKWQPAWEKWPELTAFGQTSLPNIPAQLVVPHLNPEQKAVWNGLPKTDQNGFAGWNQQQNQDPDNDGWWGTDGEDGADGKNAEEKPAVGAIQILGNGVLELSE